jgi:hypothetical protein
MTIAELLLPEVDQEIATTRHVLERVPDDKLGWMKGCEFEVRSLKYEV